MEHKLQIINIKNVRSGKKIVEVIVPNDEFSEIELEKLHKSKQFFNRVLDLACFEITDWLETFGFALYTTERLPYEVVAIDVYNSNNADKTLGIKFDVLASGRDSEDKEVSLSYTFEAWVCYL